MGKYMRKCKGIGETVMEVVAQVGVTTRARSALTMEEGGTDGTATSTGATKRRKVVSEELQSSPSCAQLSSPLPVITPQKSVSPANSENSDPVITEERSSSPNSDHVQVSQGLSNGSTEVVEENWGSVDLENQDDCFHIENLAKDSDRRQRETTPSSEVHTESGDLEPAERPSAEMNSRYRSTGVRMPTQAELDEFFAAAEKKEQKRFADKYNFDVVKDVPLEGRYEWVRVKP